MGFAFENNTMLNLPQLYNSAGETAKTLLPGTSHFIIGDHASGKTTLAAAVAATYAVNSELPCYFFTNGEPKEQLEKMMSCSLNISEGKLSDDLPIAIRDPSNQRGLLPMFAQRIIGELKKPQTDWRTILNDFIQEEIVDYSFTPPDRRFDDSPFYLPDFNDKDDLVKDILFMIDTSASMSDEMITAAYSEIKGAIDQFDGRLQGWLGFFDAAIIEPKPFSNEKEFRIIKPAGGGGTDFQIIFEYGSKHMQDNPPASIIILTDGYAPFPKESLSMGIPVLWLLNNDDVEPPWGKTVRITV